MMPPSLLPLSVSTVTMIPANTTPSAMSGIAFRAGIPKAQEASEPVHAPVMGSGMATSTTKNAAPYLANRLLYACSSDSVRQSNNLVRKSPQS